MQKLQLVERLLFLFGLSLVLSALAIALIIYLDGLDRTLKLLCDLF